jgi:MscS family membrane protein
MPINFDQLREPLGRVLLVFLVLLLIWLLRRLMVLILARPLQRVLERSGRTEIDGLITNVVVPPARILLIAASIFIIAQLLNLDSAALQFSARITRTLVITAVALIAYRLVTLVFLTRGRLFSITGIAIEEALLPFARTGLQVIIFALSLVIIIQEWGYDVSGLIAGLGIGGLAISLAAQDSLSNLFGFTAIVGDRPFAVGEYIRTKDVEGLIEHVGLRSTRVRQLDQAVVTVPNSLLASSAILNWSRLSKRRIDTKIGIIYGATPDQLEALLQRLRETIAAREHVDEASVIVNLINFGESALEILIRCYVNLSDWAQFTQEKEYILLEIMRTVDDMGLQIAFPTRSLYIENLRELLGQPVPRSDSAVSEEEDAR